MAIQILTARETATSYDYTVHLDNSKVLEDGSPDPAFVRAFSWGKSAPLVNVVDALGVVTDTEPMSKADYLAMQEREILALCQHELTQIAEPVALASEGKSLI